jgi:hypothetical protein
VGLTLVDILQNPLPVAYLYRRHGMNDVMKVRHGGLAHRLLMSHGCDHELSRFLEGQGERRALRLLAVSFAIDTIT